MCWSVRQPAACEPARLRCPGLGLEAVLPLHLGVGDGAALGGHPQRVLQVRARPLHVALLEQQPAVIGVRPVLRGTPPQRRLAQDALILGHGGGTVAALQRHLPTAGGGGALALTRGCRWAGGCAAARKQHGGCTWHRRGSGAAGPPACGWARPHLGNAAQRLLVDGHRGGAAHLAKRCLALRHPACRAAGGSRR